MPVFTAIGSALGVTAASTAAGGMTAAGAGLSAVGAGAGALGSMANMGMGIAGAASGGGGAPTQTGNVPMPQGNQMQGAQSPAPSFADEDPQKQMQNPFMDYGLPGGGGWYNG